MEQPESDTRAFECRLHVQVVEQSAPPGIRVQQYAREARKGIARHRLQHQSAVRLRCAHALVPQGQPFLVHGTVEKRVG